MQIPLSVVSTVWMSSPISEEELSELPECVISERPVRRAERARASCRSRRRISDQKNMLLLSSSSRCLQMPLWPLLAAAALFGTWSGPQHMTLQSHTETGRRCLRAPPCRARPRAGAPCLSLTAVIPPVRTGTGAAGAVDARSCASMVHQMASATMAALEPSSQSAASAPTALTAALGRQLIFPLIWPRPHRHRHRHRPRLRRPRHRHHQVRPRLLHRPRRHRPRLRPRSRRPHHRRPRHRPRLRRPTRHHRA